MAVNWDFRPFAIAGFAGVTPKDTRVAAVTVRLVDPEIPLKLAVMVVEPGPAVVAKPLAPGRLLIDATLAAEEFQVTALVKS